MADNEINIGEITFQGDNITVYVSLTWSNGKPSGVPRLRKYVAALREKYGGIVTKFEPERNLLATSLTIGKTQRLSSVYDEIKNALMLENNDTSPTFEKCVLVHRTWGDPEKTGGTGHPGGPIPEAINWWDNNVVKPFTNWLKNAMGNLIPSGGTIFSLGLIVLGLVILAIYFRRK